ncbi:type II toxin-antitoxin system RelE/ParE family toxin [Tepidimonas alkaliphilus]|uniref:type II toxin-antitoxin system RelE/ParE family toxin n=1 Tax=Tepidimonas alkaliphilus TaxID=2588942 RepID=UPI0011815A36|nr:type II toxin-antitoxin system RelE/ParE family toxin [Tepidimonas alkaliphilus]
MPSSRCARASRWPPDGHPRPPSEADNPAAALAIDELLAEKAARLLDHPRLGRPGRVAGTRELVAHLNYILIYAIAGEQVRVLRVLRAARQ